MKLSSIKSMLEGKLAIADFKANIVEEMSEYKSSSKTTGKSMPVYLNEDVEISIGKNDLNKLCRFYINDELNELEINYIADGLLLSNRVVFANENISDQIGYLTDPEINGKLTKNVALSILESQS